MRLLHTTDWTFHEHRSGDVYCILSHRWSDEDEQEIHYEDARAGNWKVGTAGHAKLSGACSIARSLGFRYIWVDTCCIKRESDSELSEAINSMYRWYAEAELCIAYLVDVPSITLDDFVRVELTGQREALRKSSWFTRGWTLQELLAPRNVYFYDHDFNCIGTKNDLLDDIAEITGIAPEYLTHEKSIKSACMAVRISWASKRVTKRKEDEAYCLLGILDVNIPLLYGERDRAFFRLQLEILNRYDDDTIFAWASASCAQPNTLSGMLANSPHDFTESGGITRTSDHDIEKFRTPPYSWTQRGILAYGRAQRLLIPFGRTTIDLACINALSGTTGVVCIQLLRIGEVWYRTHCDEFAYTPFRKRFSHTGKDELYVAQPLQSSSHATLDLTSAADVETVHTALVQFVASRNRLEIAKRGPRLLVFFLLLCLSQFAFHIEFQKLVRLIQGQTKHGVQKDAVIIIAAMCIVMMLFAGWLGFLNIMLSISKFRLSRSLSRPDILAHDHLV